MTREATPESERRVRPYERTALALERILSQASPGDCLPSEPELAKQLGISRATLREAMRTFEDRGVIVRRQGVGTYVTRPDYTESGLELLESILSQAERLDLQVELGELSLHTCPPTPDEAAQFGLSIEDQIEEMVRTVWIQDRPVAYLIDRLPQELVPAQALAPGFKGTVIDSLLELDEPELFFSKMEITAVGASPALARDLEVNQGSALILFEGFLFTKRGKAIDHSLRYFLPGIFRFHITRRVSYSDHRGRD